MSPYDADVIVVGAGPAGLAAATRVRWVKGYHALASSVCLLDSGPPGGLLRWGSCILTGPGWAYRGEELTETLLADVERLRIPIHRERVVAVRRDGPLFVVESEDGTVRRSLAVILTTGFRPLANESDLYQRGVRITYKGYDHFPSLIRACARDAAGRGLVVVGNDRTSHLQALLERWSAGAGEVTVLDEGRLLEVLGEQRVEAVRVDRGRGPEVVPCGAVLMDYNAFELTPDFPVVGVTPSRDDRGFVEVDAWMRTSEPGVFAAGDLTGRYASTLMALGDGVCAGFSAYAWAFERKLGQPPKLFAYAATDEPLPEEPRDLPELPEDAVVVPVGDGAPPWVDGARTVAALAAARGETVPDLRDALHSAIAGKTITIHRVHGASQHGGRS